MRLKKALLPLALAASLWAATPAQAQETTGAVEEQAATAEPADALGAEVFSTPSRTRFDIKYFNPLTERFQLYVRNIGTVEHDGDNHLFGLVDTIFPLKAKDESHFIDAVWELQYLSDGSVIPRLGGQYTGFFGDWTFFTIDTVETTSTPDLEAIASLTYRPEGPGWRPTGYLETITNYSGEGWFATQQFRAGMTNGTIDLGAGIGATQITGVEPDWSAGVYATFSR